MSESEGSVEQDKSEFRAHQLKHLPNDALVGIIAKLFDYLTSFVVESGDEAGKRAFDLIVEKGETYPDHAYYCSRRFELGKNISAVGGKLPAKVDVLMKVIITAVAEVPTTDVEFKVSEEAAKKYNPPEAHP